MGEEISPVRDHRETIKRFGVSNGARDPGLAAVFSFVFSGLGQLYNGQIFKGLAIISVNAVSLLILIIGSILIGCWILGRIMFPKELILGIALFSFGLVLICAIGIYSILDAYKVARKK